MRLNRGTFILIFVSAVVIIAVLILSNSQVNAPDTDVTPTAEVDGAGPLFADLDAGTLIRFEVRDNAIDQVTALERDPEVDEPAWSIVETNIAQDLATDDALAAQNATTFVELEAVRTITTDDLEAFGLTEPTHTITAEDANGETYTIDVGNRAPSAPRYYTLINEDTETVYLLQVADIDALTGLIFAPPYVPSPTPTASPTRTPNPFSEVEQTQTAEAQLTDIAATETAAAATPTPSTDDASDESDTDNASTTTPSTDASDDD